MRLLDRMVATPVAALVFPQAACLFRGCIGYRRANDYLQVGTMLVACFSAQHPHPSSLVSAPE